MIKGFSKTVSFALVAAAILPSASAVHAQFSVPKPSAQADPATLFRNQCGTCHTIAASEPRRQGPALGGIVGRKAGHADGFKYSAGFARADWSWDAARLDAWLTNPQSVIPGTIMVYRQANAATRDAIINWLKEQH